MSGETARTACIGNQRAAAFVLAQIRHDAAGQLEILAAVRDEDALALTALLTGLASLVANILALSYSPAEIDTWLSAVAVQSAAVAAADDPDSLLGGGQ